MSDLTATPPEERYGVLLRSELSEYTSHKALRTVLEQRQPPIDVSEGVLRQWLETPMKPLDASTVSSTEDLQEKYGDGVKVLVKEHATAYKICKALRSQALALYRSDGIAKQWFKKYGRRCNTYTQLAIWS